jgi:hypothetical protein
MKKNAILLLILIIMLNSIGICFGKCSYTSGNPFVYNIEYRNICFLGKVIKNNDENMDNKGYRDTCYIKVVEKYLNNKMADSVILLSGYGTDCRNTLSSLFVDSLYIINATPELSGRNVFYLNDCKVSLLEVHNDNIVGKITKEKIQNMNKNKFMKYLNKYHNKRGPICSKENLYIVSAGVIILLGIVPIYLSHLN